MQRGGGGGTNSKTFFYSLINVILKVNIITNYPRILGREGNLVENKIEEMQRISQGMVLHLSGGNKGGGGGGVV